MRKYIADTRAKQATPILLSVTIRNIWKGRPRRQAPDRTRHWATTAAIKQLAQDQHVAFVDMAAVEADRLQALGPEKTALLFPIDHTPHQRRRCRTQRRIPSPSPSATPTPPWSPTSNPTSRRNSPHAQLSPKSIGALGKERIEFTLVNKAGANAVYVRRCSGAHPRRFSAGIPCAIRVRPPLLHRRAAIAHLRRRRRQLPRHVAVRHPPLSFATSAPKPAPSPAAPATRLRRRRPAKATHLPRNTARHAPRPRHPARRHPLRRRSYRRAALGLRRSLRQQQVPSPRPPRPSPSDPTSSALPSQAASARPPARTPSTASPTSNAIPCTCARSPSRAPDPSVSNGPLVVSPPPSHTVYTNSWGKGRPKGYRFA